MAKAKKKSNKRKDADKGAEGVAEVRRAEKRLSTALAEVETARAKVVKRERDLAGLLARHGIDRPDSPTDFGTVPLDTPQQTVSENGTSRDPAIDEPTGDAASEAREHQPAPDHVEQHGEG